MSSAEGNGSVGSPPGLCFWTVQMQWRCGQISSFMMGRTGLQALRAYERLCLRLRATEGLDFVKPLTQSGWLLPFKGTG